MVDDITHLKVVCTRCSDDAPFTKKKDESDLSQLIGGADLYDPLCWKCYMENDTSQPEPPHELETFIDNMEWEEFVTANFTPTAVAITNQWGSYSQSGHQHRHGPSWDRPVFRHNGIRSPRWWTRNYHYVWVYDVPQPRKIHIHNERILHQDCNITNYRHYPPKSHIGNTIRPRRADPDDDQWRHSRLRRLKLKSSYSYQVSYCIRLLHIWSTTIRTIFPVPLSFTYALACFARTRVSHSHTIHILTISGKKLVKPDGVQ